MTRAVAPDGAAFGELKVSAEWLPLAVDEVAELASRAKSRVPVAECLLAAVPHVRMGPAQADDAESLQPLYGIGADGTGGRGHALLYGAGASGCHTSY